jgi:hypothetical protein
LPSSSSSVLFDSKGDSATAIAPAREQAIANVKSSAKFKSKMPPKLPIPKSPYITIPPGLSPTMLLQSPVLLPSIKVKLSSPLCMSYSVLSGLWYAETCNWSRSSMTMSMSVTIVCLVCVWCVGGVSLSCSTMQFFC